VAEAVATYGLTHLALTVPDVERAFGFYEAVFGMVAVYRKEEFIQAQTPGSRDVLVFQRGKRDVGKSGGVAHFGFRLVDPASIDAAARRVIAAGGTIEEQGDFCPGEPYLYARDRDGYLLEIWHEIPTPVDPPGAKPRNRSVVFVCEHGSAKSVIAAAHFQRLAAAAGLDVRAISRGTDPDPELPPNAINGLARDGLRPPEDAPRRLTATELANATQVVTFCDLPAVYSDHGPIERWEDIPAVSDDYDTARRVIVTRVERLVSELRSQV
jgi:catechol 2,3-dioxygenase-like lactoylglutathione lyase family enzyme/protein-tyrosine-phosphatase